MRRILCNLPEGFFHHRDLREPFERLDRLGDVLYRSANRPDELLPDAREADALLMWSWPVLSYEQLAACERLKFSAHLDVGQRFARTLIDRGIAVSVGRRAFSPAVAEMALTLILAALRRTSTHHAAMRSGDEQWAASFPDDIDRDERELTGRRVGIIGFGGIGQRLTELLAPFRCRICIHDPHVNVAAAHRAGVQSCEIDPVIAHAEILVLCASANSESRHLLDARRIGLLAPRSIFVNVCRASLVETEALVRRLQRGDIYAALDVFDLEPLPADDPLRTLPNAYLTPHRAGGTIESAHRILTWLVDDMEAWFHGRPISHRLMESMLPTLDA